MVGLDKIYYYFCFISIIGLCLMLGEIFGSFKCDQYSGHIVTTDSLTCIFSKQCVKQFLYNWLGLFVHLL